MEEYDVVDYSSSSSDLGGPKRHWLQRTSLDFLNLCASRDTKHAIGKDLTLIYDKLTLHLCPFVKGSLQLFKAKSSISSNENGILCVPSEVVDIDADDPRDHKMRLPEQDIPVHDIVLGLLQDEVRSGALRSVQLMDVIFDDFVLVGRSTNRREKDGYEYHRLEVAVMLSLDPATVMSLGRTLTLPRLGRSPVHYQPDLQLLSLRTAETPRLRGEMHDLLDHSLLERLFKREGDFRSWDVINHHHRYDKEWEQHLCARRITSAVSVWKVYKSHPRSELIHGFVTCQKDNRNNIVVFLMDQQNVERNKGRTEFRHDLGDGKGRTTYRIIGRLAVGDLSKRDCTSFSRRSNDFVKSIIGQDARVKIKIVDLWHV
ncbi:hypothetical protein M409DRAFT_21096 [Zasmidium cellare ATCC 36951]|uniref:Uncharacterized protein n=1 Tax=Zasmidium cellare ATCC 36951 TaxID=1080233 RepID=A0A6A6CPQ1_ZASCE|nr:uncharacterized protein M409DRAFT_21096 [Zasmidium cellare ATCC 36951]KAF2169085.1 hypothetical protein M409DRAFT_21096 [Zasmidium cellare ATCC 36951]